MLETILERLIFLNKSCKLLSDFFSLHPGEALQCYTCVGSSDDDCNRQGSQQCPGHADACAVIRGQASKCHRCVRLVAFATKEIVVLEREECIVS